MNLPRRPIQTSHLFYILPFATVFLLLLAIMSTYSVFVFIPGIPVQISYPAGSGSNQNLSAFQTVIIKPNGKIIFEKKELSETEFYEKIKNLSRLISTQQVIYIKPESGVSSLDTKKIIDSLNSMNIKAQITYDLPDIPVAEPLTGDTGASLFITIDPNGLLYFENQVVDEPQLRIRLSSLVKKANEPLMLVVIADKSVPYEFIVKVGSIARSAGVKKLLLATKPPPAPIIYE